MQSLGGSSIISFLFDILNFWLIKTMNIDMSFLKGIGDRNNVIILTSGDCFVTHLFISMFTIVWIVFSWEASVSNTITNRNGRQMTGVCALYQNRFFKEYQIYAAQLCKTV